MGDLKRLIVCFALDEECHWTAELDCGHAQHTRHDPPLVERPWVLTGAGRDAHLGSALDCVRCDRRELPDDYVAYRRTASLDEASVPAALRARHGTKRGVWAKIRVESGRLRYKMHEPFHEETVLEPGREGTVLPGVDHEVEPVGDVRFHVEFYRRGDPGD